MSINIPFNFNPTSVSTKVAPYNIPAGSYAFVTVEVEDGATFSIDGVTALNAKAQTSCNSEADSVFHAASTDTTYFTVGTNKLAILKLIITATSGGVNLYIGGNLISGSIATGDYTFYMASGDSFRFQSSGGEDVTFYYSIHEYDPNITETVTTASFWVPTGTALTGSGQWRATVALFNEIT